MYRFALRPRWMLSHLFALGLVVLFVMLGLWQLRRHDERVDRNAEIVARSARAPAAAEELAGDRAEELRYRAVVAEGRYDDEVLVVDNRSSDGLPGGWLVSPLRLDGGLVVAVVRGFQGFVDGEVPALPPPDGSVAVEGTVLSWADRSCGTRTDEQGGVIGAACLDQDAAEAAFGTELVGFAVQVASSDPADAASLTAVPLPELGTGPHRSYAVQWFIFATIGTIGYPLILRKVAKDRMTEPEPS